MLLHTFGSFVWFLLYKPLKNAPKPILPNPSRATSSFVKVHSIFLAHAFGHIKTGRSRNIIVVSAPQIYKGDPRTCAILCRYGVKIEGIHFFPMIKITVVLQVRMLPASTAV